MPGGHLKLTCLRLGTEEIACRLLNPQTSRRTYGTETRRKILLPPSIELENRSMRQKRFSLWGEKTLLMSYDSEQSSACLIPPSHCLIGCFRVRSMRTHRPASLWPVTGVIIRTLRTTQSAGDGGIPSNMTFSFVTAAVASA